MITALRYLLVGTATILLVLLPGGYLDQLSVYVSQSVAYGYPTQGLPDDRDARPGDQSKPVNMNMDMDMDMDSMDSMSSPGGLDRHVSGLGSPASHGASAAVLNEQTGRWVNVTPANADVTNDLDCGNFGASSMVSDPARPSNLYTHFDCQGIWKSSDFGQTWTGPINTGTGGAGANGAGGIAIGRGSSGGPPILYSAGIRGTGIGFWRSLDDGVSWTNYTIAPAASDRQDVYPASVDPYDGNHLIMTGHELNAIYQSVDGGANWTAVNINSGMNQSGGSGLIFFINTGNAMTTHDTWLWMAQGTGGLFGTWRTANGGASWTKVDNNEHSHGGGQLYQPDTSGVVYMGGVYSSRGWGVLRSADYGQTWVHVGAASGEAIVFGTPNNVYAAYGWAAGHGRVDPNFQIAPQPGTTGWIAPGAPTGMSQGPIAATVVFDGTQYVVLTANYLGGLWRYVETASATQPLVPTPERTDPPPIVPADTPTVVPADAPTCTCDSDPDSACCTEGSWLIGG